MVPALAPGDRVWVDPRAYRDRSPARGDIVVVRDPYNPKRRLVKRVFGAPGDRVYLAGRRLHVLDPRESETELLGRVDPEDSGVVGWTVQRAVFVVGDLLEASRDSREFGLVPISLIVGRVWYRYAPRERQGPLERSKQTLSDV